MKNNLKFIYSIILICWQFSGQAQVNVEARLDTNSMLLGDQVNMELSFSGPSGSKVTWPALADSLTDKIEIVDKSKIDTAYSQDKSQMFLRQNLKITSFDSGYWAIPPFRFTYKKTGNSESDFAETDALLLHVNSIPVNMQQEIKDIKGPLSAPYTLREALPWIIGFLLLVGLGYFIYYYIRKRKKEEPLFRISSRPKLPPHQIAFDAFEVLRQKKLWQSGKVKEYHSELTDILRIYLLGRFSIHALEMTTDEIMESISQTSAIETAKELLQKILVLADLVKFAKVKPLPDEHDMSLSNAIEFVKETMHVSGSEGETQTQELQEPQAEEKEIENPVTVAVDNSETDKSDGKEVKDV